VNTANIKIPNNTSITLCGTVLCRWASIFSNSWSCSVNIVMCIAYVIIQVIQAKPTWRATASALRRCRLENQCTTCNKTTKRFLKKSTQHLRPPYKWLFESKRLKHSRLKFTFYAANFVCRLSWSISSNFCAIHCWNMRRRLKSQKNITNPLSRFQNRSRSSMYVYPQKAYPAAAFVTTSSKSVSVSDRFHAS